MKSVVTAVVVGLLFSLSACGSSGDMPTAQEVTDFREALGDPDAIPELPGEDQVDWSQYGEGVRDRIAQKMIADDCQALDDEMQGWHSSNATHKARFGENNADIMGWIDDVMHKIGCYDGQ